MRNTLASQTEWCLRGHIEQLLRLRCSDFECEINLLSLQDFEQRGVSQFDVY